MKTKKPEKTIGNGTLFDNIADIADRFTRIGFTRHGNRLVLGQTNGHIAVEGVGKDHYWLTRYESASDRNWSIKVNISTFVNVESDGESITIVARTLSSHRTINIEIDSALRVCVH